MRILRPRWLFDNPERANGINLEVAIEQVDYHKLAAAFEKVTGRPARYIDTEFNACSERSAPEWPLIPQPDTTQISTTKAPSSFCNNFTGFWNIWKHGVIQRDYALLNEINADGGLNHVEEWLLREDQLGRKLGEGMVWEKVHPKTN